MAEKVRNQINLHCTPEQRENIEDLRKELDRLDMARNYHNRTTNGSAVHYAVEFLLDMLASGEIPEQTP
jgi:hypothetical protein